jgi:hypothetical protein
LTPRTLVELRGLLLADGLDAGDPDHWRSQLSAGPATPWFVRILVGFGAWLAGMMLAVGLSVVLAFDKHSITLVIAGLVVCAGSALLRNATRGDFPVQFALSMSLAGQAMVGVGLGMESDHGAGWGLFLIGMTVLEAVLLLGFRDTVHRFLSALAGVVLFTFLLEHYKLAWLESAFVGLLLLAWCLLPIHTWKGFLLPLRRPVGYALATVFLGLFTWHSLERMLFHHGSGTSLWASGFQGIPVWILGALAPGLLLCAAALRILLRLGESPAATAGLLVLTAVLSLSLLGIRVPGIPAMIFVLIVAVEARESAMFGLAVIAGLLMVTRLYYEMDLSLLAKSGVLAGSGVVLLGLRAALGGRLKP